jgi:hypothetical protein
MDRIRTRCLTNKTQEQGKMNGANCQKRRRIPSTKMAVSTENVKRLLCNLEIFTFIDIRIHRTNIYSISRNAISREFRILNRPTAICNISVAHSCTYGADISRDLMKNSLRICSYPENGGRRFIRNVSTLIPD